MNTSDTKKHITISRSEKSCIWIICRISFEKRIKKRREVKNGRKEKNRQNRKPVKWQKKCGGCQYQGVPYKEQLKKKQKMVNALLSKYGKVEPIIGMENPYYYRNKVHAVFDRDRKGNIVSGTYEAKTHRVVPVENCLIEDKKSQEIIRTIRGLLKSFKIKTYDEDTGYDCSVMC